MSVRSITTVWVLLYSLLSICAVGCDDSSGGGSRDAGPDGGDGGDGDDDGGVPDDGDGETGEDCVGPEDCLPSLDCIDDVCQPSGCTEGFEGCVCADGDVCTVDSSGNDLACIDGVCMSPDCSAAGETSCPCINNAECTAGGDVCENGFCVSGDCLAGADGCECLAGGCDPGLFCKDGAICIDGAGHEGGACLAEGDCYLNNFCDELLQICVHCELGSEGCQCIEETGSCDTGLSCWSGYCSSYEELPPTDPKCYTPCQDELSTGTDIIECDSDGLVAGCIDETSCLNGSCVISGEAKPTCTTEVDCPFFQTCLQGGCYSNCEVNGDCSGGRECYMKVCRTTCQSTSGGSTCGTNSFCEAPDGENGFCVALKSSRAGEGDADGGVPPETGLVLSAESFDFSSILTSSSLDIIGISEWPQDVTVRKLSHTLIRSDGSTETVEAETDPDTGALLECDAVAGECPLWWLTISQDASSTTDQQMSFKVMPDCEDTTTCPQVGISDAAAVDAVKWEGVVEIVAPGAPSTRLHLYYTEVPDGQWAGEMHYYGNFSKNGISDWLSTGETAEIDNGLLKRWLAFRDGSMTGGWHEMKAILQSTETRSWKFGEVAKRCTEDASLPEGACYPYINTMGIKPYVQDLSASPIPSGAVEYPVAFNLRRDPDDNAKMVGRIETSIGMHYSANPSIGIAFEADPTAPDSCEAEVTTDCIVGLTNLYSEIVVGGQYVRPIGANCDEGFVPKEVPWLVPGFKANTLVSEETGYRYRYICRDDEVPYDSTTDVTLADLNMELSEANPVPDGTQRRRSLELLDGALINQTELFILFRESFESFIMYADEPEITTAYGYMILTKQPADLGNADDNANNIPDAFEGSTPPAIDDKGGDKLGLSCDQSLIDDTVNGGTGKGIVDLDGYQITQLVNTMLKGNLVEGTVTPLNSDRTSSDALVHYLCEDTGLFNGGEADRGGVNDVLIPCPAGSKVTFFLIKDGGAFDPTTIANEDCQEDVKCENLSCDDLPDDEVCENTFRCTGGTCQTTLNKWKNNGLVETWEPFWQCADADKIYCDENRLDLRDEKVFFAPADTSSSRVFLPLQPEINSAFRYKTRFQSRSGAQIGFAPEICIPNSDEIPYCYDPPAIEEIRDRVDCLLSIYSLSDYDSSFSEDTINGPKAKIDLETFLRGSYSEFKVYSDVNPLEVVGTYDGFERLYTELLVMQGDEALTAAFASRFDLAGAGGATFEGSKLETGGIDLSGVAGFEMHRLYRSVQYYQMGLDRLYRAGPNMSVALDRHHPSKPGGSGTDSAANFISPETVVLYFDRLIGASTQKARAWSEIAKRYQNFNRPDLARSVIERAYTSTYLEGAILSNLMWDIDAQSTTSKRAQIVKTIEDGQLRYRMAMLKMQDLYHSITDDVNYFGLAPDYIPFPALDTSASLGDNGFEVLLASAENKTGTARQREDLAISSNRSYNTDAAAFQSELTHIRLSYEDRLAALCGVFTGFDGSVYPAIKKYASQHTYATLLGDPCGRLGNGALWNAMGQWEDSLYAQMQIEQQASHKLKEMDIERTKIAEKCNLSQDKVNLQVSYGDQTYDLERQSKIITGGIKAGVKLASGGIKLAASLICVPNPAAYGTNCANDAINGVADLAVAVAEVAGDAAVLANDILHENQIHALENQKAKALQDLECTAFDIDLRANLQKMWLDMEKFGLQSIRALHTSQLLASEIDRISKEAKRVQAQQEDTEQLSINVEAARNDPNVRIYKNDAIINADVAFEDSMRAAYRATRMFEYYTSQTYAYKDQLFLIRMVGAGEYNLENYLMDLGNAFYEFEEEYGIPDLRVEVLSLRDDIMRIPKLDDNGIALSQAERIDMMRDQLADVNFLDTNGYLNIPFSTGLDRMSPLTRNHKVRFIETDIVGSDVGDTVGRLYIRQVGTGVVHNIYGETDYYVFPERTAVINPFFNGNRVFDPVVYKNGRLRDLPMVNTAWQMIFNQRDEEANKDVNLQSLSDIRCYVYYTDFTSL